MIGDLLELCASHIMINEEDTSHNAKNLVEKVDLGDGVLLVARVLHQQGDQAHKSIQGVETFRSDQSLVAVLLSKSPVAQVDAHLGGHSEESGDQVVRLEQPVHVHLLDEDGEGLGGVLAGAGAVVHVHPVPQQELRLLQQPMGVVELPGLRDATVKLSGWSRHGQVVLDPLRGHLDHVHQVDKTLRRRPGVVGDLGKHLDGAEQIRFDDVGVGAVVN